MAIGGGPAAAMAIVLFTIAMAAAGPPSIAITPFHNTHATFPFIF
jgi:hypothetical protein